MTLQFCPSVRRSVAQVDQSKTVQARILVSIKLSMSAPWKNLVLGSVKLFLKFERGQWVTLSEGAK